MSWFRTEGTSTNALTGIPVITGLIWTTESGIFIATQPVGEAPGGRNTTPGIDPNAVSIVNSGAINMGPPGVPYGFSAPVFIGPLVTP